MNGLRRLQQHFQEYLLARRGPIEEDVIGSEALDARARLAIYADAYRLRLLETLATDYSALRAFLGEEGFEALGRVYIEQHPSRSTTLRDYGAGLAAFLRAVSPWCAEPLLAELAAFDWALTTAFDAPDAPVVTAEELSAIDPERWPALTFTLHPSVIRLDLEWNAPAIWKAAEEKQALPAPAKAEHPLGWVVWRQNLQTFFRSLCVDEAFALDAARRGASFAEICEGLCEWIDPQNVPTHAAGLLRRWIEDGLIESVACSG